MTTPKQNISTSVTTQLMENIKELQKTNKLLDVNNKKLEKRIIKLETVLYKLITEQKRMLSKYINLNNQSHHLQEQQSGFDNIQRNLHDKIQRMTSALTVLTELVTPKDKDILK